MVSDFDQLYSEAMKAELNEAKSVIREALKCNKQTLETFADIVVKWQDAYKHRPVAEDIVIQQFPNSNGDISNDQYEQILIEISAYFTTSVAPFYQEYKRLYVKHGFPYVMGHVLGISDFAEIL